MCGVRKAMNLAVDQKAITDASPSASPSPRRPCSCRASWTSNPKLDQSIYGENVKEAERLLDEAGWKKGSDGSATRTARSLRRSSTVSPGFKEIAEAVQGDLRKVGHRPANPALRFDGGLGKLATQSVRRLRHELPLCQRRRCTQPLLRSPTRRRPTA